MLSSSETRRTPARRQSARLVASNEILKWLDKGVPCHNIEEDPTEERILSPNSIPTLLAKGESYRVLHKGFRKGELVVRVGDTVLIKNEKSITNAEHELPHVGVVVRLWEQISLQETQMKDKLNRKAQKALALLQNENLKQSQELRHGFVAVQWFYRANSLRALTNAAGKRVTQEYSDHDLFFSNEIDDIPVDNILDVSNVHLVNATQLDQSQSSFICHADFKPLGRGGIVSKCSWRPDLYSKYQLPNDVIVDDSESSSSSSESDVFMKNGSSESDDSETDSDSAATTSSSDSDEQSAEESSPRSTRRRARPEQQHQQRRRRPLNSAVAQRQQKIQNLVHELIAKRSQQSSTVQWSTSDDPFDKARACLHVSAVPENLPCREGEFAEILVTVQSAIQDRHGCCLYVSGVPGLGKTATVHEVIRHLQREVAADRLPDFDFVEINGMKLTEPQQVYSQLYGALENEKITPQHALTLLEKRFSTASPNRQMCVLLMDEIDLLVSRKETVMYNLMDWPNRPHSRLVVIAVANTMDLPERLLTNRVASRLGMTRLNFQPYSFVQLSEIIRSRLASLDEAIFESDAIELCARRTSAVSGDARRALDICRRAVELANRDPKKPGKVSMDHVSAAVKEMSTSPEMLQLRRLPFYQKLFLAALALRTRSLEGVGASSNHRLLAMAATTHELEYGDACEALLQLCRIHNFPPPHTAALADMVVALHQTHAIVLEGGAPRLFRKVRLQVHLDELKMAWREDDFLIKLLS